MTNFSKTIWFTPTPKILAWGLIIFLIIFIIAAGFFAYQWRQVQGELIKQIEQNENLIKQASDLQIEIDKLQKEIEGLKVSKETKEEVIDETTEWKTYRNEERGFEIKYPEDMNIYIADSWYSTDNFTKETLQNETEFRMGIGMYADDWGPWETCRVEGKKVVIEGITFYPKILYVLPSSKEYTGKRYNDKCQEWPLGNNYDIEVNMCFDEDLKYLGSDCPICWKDSNVPRSSLCPEWKTEGYWGNYYQFSIRCKEEQWKGKEGIDKCNLLFNQILSTFKFIK